MNYFIELKSGTRNNKQWTVTKFGGNSFHSLGGMTLLIYLPQAVREEAMAFQCLSLEIAFRATTITFHGQIFSFDRKLYPPIISPILNERKNFHVSDFS